MSITKVFGDNSKSWNENFGPNSVKLHLCGRSFLLFASLAFYGAMLVIDSGDKLAYKKTLCVQETQALEEVFAAR